MRRRTAAPVLALLGLTFLLATLPGWMATGRAPGAGQARPAPVPSAAQAVDTLAGLPLAFEPNRGQADAGTDYVARGPGFRLALGPAEATLDLSGGDASGGDGAGTPLRLRLVGSDPGASSTAGDPLPTRTNYLVGDPSSWLTDVPSYGKVTYDDVYPGVDLVFFGNQRRLEHDFVVAPGADPGAVTFEVDGDRTLSLDAAGDLVVTGPAGGTDVRLARPVLYQDGKTGRRAVEGSFVLKGGNQVGFSVGGYDRRLPLVIDPVLITSTYLGGTGLDSAAAVEVDGAGNVYVVGATESTDFPMAKPLQPTLNRDGSTGKSDAFVTKYNPDGKTLLYSTYLGGNARDAASGVVVGGDGSVFVTGLTESQDFPKTTPAAQEIYGGGPSDAFVAKINPGGDALTYATYLGGKETDAARAITVVSSGEAIVTGSTNSVEFPSVNPLQATPPRPEDVDAFVTKVSSGGNSFAYSTRLGGSNDDHGLDVATDLGGNAYVTGDTRSPGFPTARPLQAGAGGTASGVGGSFADAFVSKLDPAGTNLVYSTFLGGSDTDQGTAIAVDGDGAAYVTGNTNSPNFPIANPIQGRKDADTDAFVSKINPGGAALVYSTYLGGGGTDSGTAIAVDRGNNATVVGSTASSNFPTAKPLQGVKGGGVTDAFLSTLNAAGTALATSTYLGGRDDDSAAGVAMAGSTPVMVGSTGSSDFPTANPLQPARSGTASDAFVTHMSQAEGADAAAATPAAVGGSGSHERRVRILVATTAGLFLIAVLQTAYLRRRSAATAEGDIDGDRDSEPDTVVPTSPAPQWGGGVRVLDDESRDDAFAGGVGQDDGGDETRQSPSLPPSVPPPGVPATAGPPADAPPSGPSTLAVPDLLEEWAGTGAGPGPPPRAPLEDLSFWDLFPEDLPPSSLSAGLEDDEWAIRDNTEDVLIGPPTTPPPPTPSATPSTGAGPAPGTPPWDDDILLTDLLAGDLGASPGPSPFAEGPMSRHEPAEAGNGRNGAQAPELADESDDANADGGHEDGHEDGDEDGDGHDAGDGDDQGASAGAQAGGTSGQPRKRPRNRRSGRRKRPTSG
ncbi:MAG: hypothetical protein QOJ69_1812 [Actinomycetota bacterium]|nr:hypothetical protein [Actinomycetota bacterium]